MQLFSAAFDGYWTATTPAELRRTAVGKVDATSDSRASTRAVAFSPHAASNALLKTIADDIETQTTSCLLFSLAFLYQTPGPDPRRDQEGDQRRRDFVYGISDRKVGGLDLQKPDGNVAPVFPAALAKNVPRRSSPEPTGGGGIRMHHKFVVIDFDKPTARVYLGSYNFSSPADTKNGENLLLIRDRRIAVSYVVEALRIFDHYHFRVVQQEAKKAKKDLVLAQAAAKAGRRAWWTEDYTDPRRSATANCLPDERVKVRDRRWSRPPNWAPPQGLSLFRPVLWRRRYYV